MLKKLSKVLGSTLKRIEDFYREKESKIWDILVYGSSVRGEEPRDFDVLVVFESVSDEEYEDIPYELKKIIEKGGISADVKGRYLGEILDPNFLAGGSIITEGYSLLSGEFLAEKLNLKNYTMFIYSLKNLDRNSKTKFTYALKGRGDNTGVLDKVNARHPAPKVILVPVQNTEDFRTFLNRWKVDYEEYRLAIRKVI